ncbi:hypothetical protein DAMNIGENAA_00440 [Desulforhabdus amnigena]|uniref:Uncharacterized protein n=1 Tax=Desulforhabdus amnigena TaxID=40218 RepID=A0A9W6CVG3_9BACT|nr:hypothetical protein DAMNIGENAA_00440 [Desulforhabdus amnigena]
MSYSRRQVAEERCLDGLQRIVEINAHGDEVPKGVASEKTGSFQMMKILESTQWKGETGFPYNWNLS